MSIRDQYNRHGVNGFYAEHAAHYENPHATDVKEVLESVWDNRWQTAMDFACGNGLITKIKQSECEFFGVDPFLADRYRHETGRHCYELNTSDFIAADIPKVDVAIISYAMDIIPESYRSLLLWKLSTLAESLVIIRPNNKIAEQQYWQAVFSRRTHQTRAVIYTRREIKV